jgi:CubicO group peptidase (beta-lactamase class C family)
MIKSIVMIRNSVLTLSLSLALVGNGVAQTGKGAAPVRSGVAQTGSGPARIRRADGLSLDTKTVDGIVKKLMDTAGVTGLCVGIVTDNKVAYVKGYGYKNKPRGELNDTATCFYGASLSKAVFAWLVMQLVDEAVIQLDTPLYSYLPEPLPDYPNYKDLAGDPRWKLITARHCLDHTTGFPNWRFFNPRGNKKLEIFFTPGSRYAYSGEGLYLLQMVVEAKTGRSLEELAQEKIFRRYGMGRTSYLWQPAFESNYAVGHTGDGDTIPKNRRTKTNAAGSMETTIADYTRFVAAVMQGAGVSARAKQEMLKPQIRIFTKHQFPSLNTDTTDANRALQLSYGLGWGVFSSSAGKVFFKEGHDDGWQHYSICFPDKGVAFVFMSNNDNAEHIYKELTERLAGVEIPWEWEGYAPYPPGGGKRGG